jgi:hypothetical protein
MTRSAPLLLLIVCVGALAACGHAVWPPLPGAGGPGVLTLAGEFNIPPGDRFPPAVGLPFGGLSGLAPLGNGQYLAVCDERDGARVYRLRITGEGIHLRVTPEDVVALEVSGGAPAALDPEGIVTTPRGTMIVASEGIGNSEPRIAPSLIEYDPDGRFLREIALRERFVPNATGPLTRGARDNAALESLTIVPGGSRLFTGLETALVQDGAPAEIGRGTVSRILEFVRQNDEYAPRREFAYPVEPVEPAAFQPALTVTGLVELLAVSDDQLLALERTYLAERPNANDRGRALNRIRLFRVSLAGATDVSHIDSLGGATYTPVQKTLLLDLSAVNGLSQELATLENFEGLAAGPVLADGSRSLLLVSDDNFHATQRTSFLLFRVARRN